MWRKSKNVATKSILSKYFCLKTCSIKLWEEKAHSLNEWINEWRRPFINSFIWKFIWPEYQSCYISRVGIIQMFPIGEEVSWVPHPRVGSSEHFMGLRTFCKKPLVTWYYSRSRQPSAGGFFRPLMRFFSGHVQCFWWSYARNSTDMTSLWPSCSLFPVCLNKTKDTPARELPGTWC